MREAVGVVAVLAGAAALAAVNHHPNHGRRTAQERAAVQAAAAVFTHRQIADAWTETKLGRPEGLRRIQAAFPLPPRAAYDDGAALVLVFDGHDDVCIDLVSRPEGKTVRSRRC